MSKAGSLSLSYRLALCAMFTAVAVVANIFTIPVIGNIFVISFMVIPCFFAGVMLGPIEGFAVGVVADLLGCLIHPLGPWMPIITLSSGLFGAIPGFIFHFFKGNVYVKSVISFLLCLLVCTAGLNTFATWLLYASGKKTFFVYLWLRFPYQSIVSAVNATICIALLVTLRHIPSLGKRFKYLRAKSK